MTGAVGLLGAAAGAVASIVLTDAKRLSLGERTVWAAFGAALSLQGTVPIIHPLLCYLSVVLLVFIWSAGKFIIVNAIVTAVKY